MAELKYEQTKDKKLTGKSQTVIENALAFVWQMIEEVEALKNDADRVAYATEVLDELGVKMPHVCKVLEVSTAHITQVTAERLGDEGDKFCIREDHGGYGWWVYVESDKTEASDSDDLLPDDLKTVIQYARSLGCLWLVLDQDVDPIDDLPEHEW